MQASFSARYWTLGKGRNEKQKPRMMQGGLASLTSTMPTSSQWKTKATNDARGNATARAISHPQSQRKTEATNDVSMNKITSRTTELTGEFSHEHRSKGDPNSPERWMVGQLVSGKKITGLAAKGAMLSGVQYTYLGQFVTNEYGTQFKFTSFVASEPTSLEAIQRYLQKSPGIGPQSAARIVGAYGTDSLDACRDRPSEVEIKCGIPQSVMSDLRAALVRGKAIEKVTMEAEQLLAGGHFPRSLGKRVIERWGENAAEYIRENPFVLRTFHGVGFKTCDALYARLGLPLDAMLRQVQCVVHAIESDVSGSTWIRKTDIVTALRRNIGGVTIKISDAIRQAVDEELIRERGEWFASAASADAEDSLVSDVFACVMETISDDGF